MKNQSKSAFSLIELSIVILIIGIIIAGITQSSRLVELYRVSSAKTQTQSSPVHSISGLVTWFETTLDESFDEKETENYNKLSSSEKALGKGRISIWKDISSSTGTKNNALQLTANNKPLYITNCINSLPCINFKTVDNNETFLNFNGSKIGNVVGTDYTIFIIEQKDGTLVSPASIIGSNIAASETLNFGYLDDNSMTWSHASGSTNYADTDTDLNLEDNNAALHVIVNENKKSFSNDANENVFYYVNGNNNAQTIVHQGNGVTNNGTDKFLSSYERASIGTGFRGGTQYFYKGFIGEIIIFSKSLKTDERDAIEEYLIKKWQIKPDNSQN